jgi:hypothetical protein
MLYKSKRSEISIDDLDKRFREAASYDISEERIIMHLNIF